MDAETERTIAGILESLSKVRSYRCRYQDLSFHPDVETRRVVRMWGDLNGRVRLSTMSGRPEVHTIITRERLLRVDCTNRTGYRIDFSRYPFSDFHRYGWLRLDRPFSLFDQDDLRFRGEVSEPIPTLLFQAGLNPLLFAGKSRSKSLPEAQFKLDSRTGLLRELLIFSLPHPQRFAFTSYVINRRLDRRAFDLEPEWEIGDMTELYWNQIALASESPEFASPFFNWN